jgi:hypothetical protein
MKTTTFEISPQAQQWLASGEQGISSKAIFSHLSGLNLSERNRVFGDTPSDPADLRRCMLLLRSVPEFEKRFDEMKTRSKEWARLVDQWSEITKTFIEEAGQDWHTKKWWSAPKTFQMIQKLKRGT